MGIRMVAGNQNTSSNCQSVYKQLCGDISLHWHDVYEFDIILSGTGETVCNNTRTQLSRGMINLLSPKDYHEYRNCKDVQLLNIQFRETGINQDILNNFLTQPSRIIFVEEATLEKLLQLHSLMVAGAEGAFHAAYEGSLLACMILIFLNDCTQGKSGSAVTTPIQNAIMYVGSHFRENPKMADVAAMFYLNESYFCRLFKKTTGKSYKAYIKELKLEYGLSLLHSTVLPVTDIAAHCGYVTPSHFNREFKARYGMPPTHFRKKA